MVNDDPEALGRSEGEFARAFPAIAGSLARPLRSPLVERVVAGLGVLAGRVERVNEFHQLVSTGLTFAPSAYFAVLAGMTWSRVANDNGTSDTVTSLTIGFGASIDVADFLFHSP